MKTGIELIAQERAEQIEKHGISIEKDVSENAYKELTIGAINLINDNHFGKPIKWDPEKWIHMSHKSYKDRLIIAGALIAAEIDRLQFEMKED
ncbi:MAG: hypothetical protein PHW73_01175 [Atribacterota bacterium]|nr:hypothetical protein [Atribacterota bacterium]